MPYLAMTAAEIRSCPVMPPKTAWMACHFSPYGTGLTNLPQQLPEGSLLILNDRTPIHGHDPERIHNQLSEAVQTLKCSAVLLDLQKKSEETGIIAAELLKLPLPVIVSELYAGPLDCPVFLPPVPLLKTVQEYISPWLGRQIWLDAALDGLSVIVTAQGSTQVPLSGRLSQPAFTDKMLHCHYSMDVSAEQAVFSLQRTREDLQALLTDAKDLGVTQSVGLYQELAM